jgi:hypothetical protein
MPVETRSALVVWGDRQLAVWGTIHSPVPTTLYPSTRSIFHSAAQGINAESTYLTSRSCASGRHDSFGSSAHSPGRTNVVSCNLADGKGGRRTWPISILRAGSRRRETLPIRARDRVSRHPSKEFWPDACGSSPHTTNGERIERSSENPGFPAGWFWADQGQRSLRPTTGSRTKPHRISHPGPPANCSPWPVACRTDIPLAWYDLCCRWQSCP